ncbi:HU family DNA-binding protein [Meiothermus sp.]|uniref:HU family DNA-binding protein n=1 Tax=Meiothermus sp. TaxID=1955249 RepID=UPI00307F2C39
MRKTDLIGVVAGKTGLSKRSAQAVIDAFVGSVQAALEEGLVVRVNGFGTFEVADRKERLGVRPGTADPIVIPARHVPVFRPARRLKDAVK